MLPKTLHFVWVGDESRCPHVCIDSWRRHHPDYEIKVWGNKEYQEENWIFRDQMARIWESGQLYGVADVMRWEILYRYGGIALDADSICLAPIPEWVLDCSAVASWENEVERPGAIACSFLGFHSKDPLISFLIKKLKQEKDLAYSYKYFGLKKKRRSSWRVTGPELISEGFRELGYRNLTILPSHFFVPNAPKRVGYTGAGPVYAVSLYGSTQDSPFAYDLMKNMSEQDILNALKQESVWK